LIMLLAILVVGLLRLHRIVFGAIIAIRHLIVTVCFTAGHGDSGIVEDSAEEEFCAKQGMRPMRFATRSECFCIPALAHNHGSKLGDVFRAATETSIVTIRIVTARDGSIAADYAIVKQQIVHTAGSTHVCGPAIDSPSPILTLSNSHSG
jgi:hypothetical protein